MRDGSLPMDERSDEPRATHVDERGIVGAGVNGTSEEESEKLASAVAEWIKLGKSPLEIARLEHIQTDDVYALAKRTSYDWHNVWGLRAEDPLAAPAPGGEQSAEMAEEGEDPEAEFERCGGWDGYRRWLKKQQDNLHSYAGKTTELDLRLPAGFFAEEEVRARARMERCHVVAALRLAERAHYVLEDDETIAMAAEVRDWAIEVLTR